MGATSSSGILRMSKDQHNLPKAETSDADWLSTGGEGQILVLACGALAREILDVIHVNGMAHVDLQCLPAIYHNHPEKIVPAVQAAVEKARQKYTQIFVAYADCGTGGQLQAAVKELGIEMIPGPHCYSFFEGNTAFAENSEDEFRAFYLTDFLVRQFESFVWKPLGLDRHPELRDMYFGNYEKLVYQAQTDDPSLTEKAMQYAENLNLPFERRQTGYGDLEKEIREFAVGKTDP